MARGRHADNEEVDAIENDQQEIKGKTLLQVPKCLTSHAKHESQVISSRGVQIARNSLHCGLKMFKSHFQIAPLMV